MGRPGLRGAAVRPPAARPEILRCDDDRAHVVAALIDMGRRRGVAASALRSALVVAVTFSIQFFQITSRRCARPISIITRASFSWHSPEQHRCDRGPQCAERIGRTGGALGLLGPCRRGLLSFRTQVLTWNQGAESAFIVACGNAASAGLLGRTVVGEHWELELSLARFMCGLSSASYSMSIVCPPLNSVPKQATLISTSRRKDAVHVGSSSLTTI
jgi:hypothetical protein